MPEIGTSGSMSGDGRRSVAAWPKLPRPSSTLPSLRRQRIEFTIGIGGTADMPRDSSGLPSDAIDPNRA